MNVISYENDFISSAYSISGFLSILFQCLSRFSSKTLIGPISGTSGYYKHLLFYYYFGFSWIYRIGNKCIITYFGMMYSLFNRFIIINNCMIYRKEKEHMFLPKNIIFICKPYCELVISWMNSYIWVKGIYSLELLLLAYLHLWLTCHVYHSYQSDGLF